MMVRFLHISFLILLIASSIFGQTKRIKALPSLTMPDSVDYLVIEDMSADTTKNVYVKDLNYRFVDKFKNQTGIGGNKTVTGLWTFSQDSLSLGGLWYDFPATRIANSVLYDSLGNGILKWKVFTSASVDSSVYATRNWTTTNFLEISDSALYATRNWVTTNFLEDDLTSAYIFVGNASNIATGVAVTGDVSITNAGVTAVSDDSHNHTTTTISGLSTADITSGTLGVGRGGLGNTTFTDDMLIYYSTGLGYFVSWTDKDNIALITGSYADPTWITSLAWSKITSTPTTLSGYGITDAVSSSLLSSKIIVGNASNVATAVSMSGDATITNAGVVAVADDSHNHTTTTISGLSTADITSGTFGVGRGGLGNTSFTDDNLVYYSTGLGYFVSWTDKDNLLTTSSSWTGGDLGGTGLAATVTDDSHNHTTTTISGLSTADITSGTLGVGRGGLGNTSFTNDMLIYYSSGLGYFVSWIDKDDVARLSARNTFTDKNTFSDSVAVNEAFIMTDEFVNPWESFSDVNADSVEDFTGMRNIYFNAPGNNRTLKTINGGYDGKEIQIINPGIFALNFVETGNIRLPGTSVALAQYDIIKFTYYASLSKWVCSYYQNND